MRLPWAVPVLMELARLTLAQCDWDTVTEVVSRLQEVDSNNVMAIAYTGRCIFIAPSAVLHHPLDHLLPVACVLRGLGGNTVGSMSHPVVHLLMHCLLQLSALCYLTAIARQLTST